MWNLNGTSPKNKQIMKQPKLNDLKIDAKGTKNLRKMMAKSKKIKITINVDENILAEVRRMAEEMGTPYQTLLNKVLRDALIAKHNEGSRLDRLEQEVERLKKKLSA
jgi:predicted DNA binding CopG/RHH family protein